MPRTPAIKSRVTARAPARGPEPVALTIPVRRSVCHNRHKTIAPDAPLCRIHRRTWSPPKLFAEPLARNAQQMIRRKIKTVPTDDRTHSSHHHEINAQRIARILPPLRVNESAKTKKPPGNWAA